MVVTLPADMMVDRIAFAFAIIGLTTEASLATVLFGVAEAKGKVIFGACEAINPESKPPEEVACWATLMPAEAACAPSVVVVNDVGVPTVGAAGGVVPVGGGVVLLSEDEPPPLQAAIKNASERTSIANTLIWADFLIETSFKIGYIRRTINNLEKKSSPP